MHRKLWVIIFALAVFIALRTSSISKTENHQETLHGVKHILNTPDSVAKSEGFEVYKRLPLYFEANKGQNDPRVRFLSKGKGYALFLTFSEIVLSFNGENFEFIQPEKSARKHQKSVLRIKWLGGNQNPQVIGVEKLDGKTNYFVGNNHKNWKTDIPNYRKVRYKDIYPGIDIVCYGNQHRFEYDFVVSPKADPDSIRLSFEGSEGISLDNSGSLVIQTGGGKIIQHLPQIYQETEDGKKLISGSYVMYSSKREREMDRVSFGFKVGSYDSNKPLVIDPILTFSTYLGGRGVEQIQDIALDSSGNVYVVGKTTSTDFPTASPIQPALSENLFGKFWRHLRETEKSSYDAFVMKIDPSGLSIVYSTYLGGNDVDYGQDIALDSSGNVYVVGSTISTDYPVLNPIQRALSICESLLRKLYRHIKGHGISCYDAFVTKLNASGSAIVYSTYLGGRSLDIGYSIGVDDLGNAYVTGSTMSSDFPTTNPIQAALYGNYDAFVAKINASGSALVYSTYLGGSSTDYSDGIVIDKIGNAYVTGSTMSSDFPTTNPIQAALHGDYDAFVAKINASGSALVYSTYLGGSSTDYSNGIVIDKIGNAYIVGHTISNDFPTTNPIQAALHGDYDAFVAKINASGSALVYSTYLGGSNTDYSYDIAIDGNGSVCITGDTLSIDFPLLNETQTKLAGDWDAYVTKLNAFGSALVLSTYLGGKGMDEGFGIAEDDSGNIFVAGWTDSTTFRWPIPYKTNLEEEELTLL